MSIRGFERLNISFQPDIKRMEAGTRAYLALHGPSEHPEHIMAPNTSTRQIVTSAVSVSTNTLEKRVDVNSMWGKDAQTRLEAHQLKLFHYQDKMGVEYTSHPSKPHIENPPVPQNEPRRHEPLPVAVDALVHNAPRPTAASQLPEARPRVAVENAPRLKENNERRTKTRAVRQRGPLPCRRLLQEINQSNGQDPIFYWRRSPLDSRTVPLLPPHEICRFPSIEPGIALSTQHTAERSATADCRDQAHWGFKTRYCTAAVGCLLSVRPTTAMADANPCPPEYRGEGACHDDAVRPITRSIPTSESAQELQARPAATNADRLHVAAAEGCSSSQAAVDEEGPNEQRQPIAPLAARFFYQRYQYGRINYRQEPGCSKSAKVVRFASP